MGLVEVYISSRDRNDKVFSGNVVSIHAITLYKSYDDQYDMIYTVESRKNYEDSGMSTLSDVEVTTTDVPYDVYPLPDAGESITEWYFVGTIREVYITISYELNEGTRIGGSEPGSYTYSTTDLFTLPSDVTKEGYKLREFSGPFNGPVLPGTEVTIDVRKSGVITPIYDQYYTYEFDLNGGTKTAGSDASTTKINGDTVILPTANKPFHTFSYYESDSGNVALMGDTVTIIGNIKYTIIWVTNTYFNISSPLTYIRPVYTPKNVKAVYNNL
tara:strand:+ start:8802 stop:9617 length:816 start_codon:yes stop_codon:yes gene_type:complete